ncbi:hypothetical protein [Cohnella thermotolerans]|uniref:hypothetical protein n=1 Tax=Cohnella thermotolerans TaxID=329858 RepID=UPI00047EAB50|nr:hypothetical protein [Cohnella thermotolerans]
MNLEPIYSQGRRSLREVRLRAGRSYSLDRGLWRGAFAGIGAASAAGAAIGMLGAPTGLGTAFDVSAAIVLNFAGLAVTCSLAAWLFRLLGLAAPPLTAGGALYAVLLVTLILFFGEMDFLFSLVLALLFVGIGAGLGVLAGIWIDRRFPLRAKLGAALLAVVAVGFVYGALTDAREATPASTAVGGTDAGSPDAAESLNAPDPSVPGAYKFRTFTYGSGEDKHRAEFAGEADLRSKSVDASAYIDDWSWLRKQYWGFDERELPVNGRVWMPEGEGPFPVVLMVHGNHLMEDFSDEGYAYLGELLASRGFAAVSVDENFLNYSVWAGIPKEDMKVRAWMLLKQIGQLQQFAADPSTPFYGRLDFGRIALIGHSRGGQAAAMAADRDTWFAGDAGLPDEDSYAVRAVVALAPTDMAVDGQKARLQDVSYLTMQGASDADVSSFDGERQYARTGFAPGSSGVKASLYIADANHGQFNTDWGDRDESLPTGLFLKKPGLSGEEQRQIAKAYVSAFLELNLHGQEAYAALFRDYRAGAAFLPDARYFNRFEEGSFRAIARYDDADSLTRLPSGATAAARGMTLWAHEEALDRERNGTGNRGVALQWEREAVYELQSDPGFGMSSDEGAAASLAFAMSDLTWDMEGGDARKTVQVTVELEDGDGNVARVPLDEVMPVQPVPRTTFTWLGWLEETLEDGKYKEEIQPVFQTYEIPLARFKAANPAWSADRIVRVAFRFGNGPGKAMLDDIGWTDGTGSE